MHFHQIFVLIFLFNYARMISLDINSDDKSPIALNFEKNK